MYAVFRYPPVYVNHRPAFGLSPAQLSQAFRVLGQRHKGGQEWVVDKGELLTMLQEKGKQPLLSHTCSYIGGW